MYHVILVDDEEEIRNGLRHKMKWHELGFQIVGEAANGREALDLLEQMTVHLMITDIRMPKMDGIALLNEQKNCFPKVKTIILSGYDDFSYAKIALQSGAKDYLLKPVVRKELAEMLTVLRDELDQEQQALMRQDQLTWQLSQNNSLLQEYLMLELISEEGAAANRFDERIQELQLGDILNEQGSIRMVCVEMKLPPGRLGDGHGQIELMRSAYRMLCKEVVQEYKHHVIVFHDWNHPDMMHFAVNFVDNPSGNEQLHSFILYFQDKIQHFLKVETVTAIGQSVIGYKNIKSAYLSSLLTWSHKKLDIPSEIIWPHDFMEQEVEFTPEDEKKLILLLEHNKLQDVSQLFHHIFSSEPYTLNALSRFVVRMYVLFDDIAKRSGIRIPHIHQFLVHAPEVVRQIKSVEQVMISLNETAAELSRLLQTSRATGGASIVASIREYIDQNYASDIGLALLAERFYINPTYLSELFKKHVGQTFSEYVNRVRIMKAEQLLHDPSMRLADIAELVGFSNASYLSTVFKKFYGKSPNDYRTALPSRPS